VRAASLVKGDAVLAALIKRHGPCGPAAAQRTDHFLRRLVRAITNQQLSTKAAATIYGRLAALMPSGTPTPEGLARVTDAQLAGGLQQPSEDRLPADLRRTCSTAGSTCMIHGRAGRRGHHEADRR
jgi:3-methyladenine DNA glycosylase/8-oxoguanine DNA glycosylase